MVERENRAVGFCLIEYLWSKLPLIALIGVEASCRRQGIGKSMLAFLEARLRSKGHGVLYSTSRR